MSLRDRLEEYWGPIPDGLAEVNRITFGPFSLVGDARDDLINSGWLPPGDGTPDINNPTTPRGVIDNFQYSVIYKLTSASQPEAWQIFPDFYYDTIMVSGQKAGSGSAFQIAVALRNLLGQHNRVASFGNSAVDGQLFSISQAGAWFGGTNYAVRMSPSAETPGSLGNSFNQVTLETGLCNSPVIIQPGGVAVADIINFSALFSTRRNLR